MVVFASNTFGARGARVTLVQARICSHGTCFAYSYVAGADLALREITTEASVKPVTARERLATG